MTLERRDGRMFYLQSELPDGPWHNEPDREQFEAAGFACIVNRGPLGAWCGYVGVPPGHPWHGREYGAIESLVDVHGGLTYSHECQGDICHKAAEGEPDNLWWLGFDCAHYMDLIPGMLAFRMPSDHPGTIARDGERPNLREMYRTIDYVRGQTALLAMQARTAAAQ